MPSFKQSSSSCLLNIWEICPLIFSFKKGFSKRTKKGLYFTEQKYSFGTDSEWYCIGNKNRICVDTGDWWLLTHRPMDFMCREMFIEQIIFHQKSLQYVFTHTLKSHKFELEVYYNKQLHLGQCTIARVFVLLGTMTICLLYFRI